MRADNVSARIVDADAFARDGVAEIPATFHHRDLAALPQLDAQAAGDRTLLHRGWCRALARTLAREPRIAALLGDHTHPVQCTLFAKSTATNWLVAPHRDLHVPVRERIDDPALRGWSAKQGVPFVEAPPDLLANLIAIRLHLDACTTVDGPLRVWPGSHRHGRHSGEGRVCPAAAGDALAMRPGLVHASSKASGLSQRRVLHFVFGPHHPPHGLRWRWA